MGGGHKGEIPKGKIPKDKGGKSDSEMIEETAERAGRNCTSQSLRERRRCPENGDNERGVKNSRLSG